MEKIEQIEMDAHREQLTSDVKALVERYRSVFGWDVPEIDQALADLLILKAIREAVDGVESTLISRAERCVRN
ncbi:hypothetical protein [Granulosicoccus antarcticus]|uniref:Uncharacterized protein n=1 Tax=Granulosicoccus antarcticus IMCC3135 TaxID=1192854 RepID=A0A2Z2NX04_9GAMM|nr:hypothetical protein [Granulosicoccus antarcticus]ASJ72267.1 hypothetical protein IMCC3135_10875 [Granulosicoccus antarcticus IMCC3135]